MPENQNKIPELPPGLLKILACPSDGGELRKDDDTLVCIKCGQGYRIVDGIPCLTVD